MHKGPGGGPDPCWRREEIFLARSVVLRCGFLLAQEGVPFLPCIYDEHNQYCGQCYGKKYFHAARIARSQNPVLYSGFASTQQKCNAQTGMVKKNVLPCPSMLSAQIFPPCASTICLAIDSPNPVPLPVLDLSTR
jgi:hypothetical protein